MPMLSIIVPVYNVEQYLKRCLNSILEQSFHDFELILINDGSKDKSGRICEEFKLIDSRVKVIHQENLGQSKARNAGLDVATGKYIGFVDSDDWIETDMYEELVNMMNKYDCDVSEVKYVTTKKDINAFKIQHKYQNRVVVREKDILLNYLHIGMKKRISSYPIVNKLYKSSVFKNTRFGNENYCEDYLINFQILSKIKKIAYSEKIGYVYYQRSDSTIHGKLKKNDFGFLTSCRMVYKLAKKIGDKKLIELAKAKVVRCYFSLLMKGILYGKDVDVTKMDIRNLQEKLRKNYLTLILSPIPMNRKIAVSLLVLLSNASLSISK